MGIQAPAKVKYAIIYETISNDNNALSISYMCEIAGVSRSGFYAWLDAAPTRDRRDEQDRKDFDLILEAYRFRGYRKGARSIYETASYRRHHECQEDTAAYEEIQSGLSYPQSKSVSENG